MQVVLPTICTIIIIQQICTYFQIQTEQDLNTKLQNEHLLLEKTWAEASPDKLEESETLTDKQEESEDNVCAVLVQKNQCRQHQPAQNTR